MKKYIHPDQKKDAPVTNQESSTNLDRKQILTLRTKPIHTIEFREMHGIITPAARTLELRKQGCTIRTDLISPMSQDGRVHNSVALHVRISEPLAVNQVDGVAA